MTLPGLVLRHELNVALRRRVGVVPRLLSLFFYIFVLGLVTWIVWTLQRITPYPDVRVWATVSLLVLLAVQSLAAVFSATVYLGGAIARERARQTLEGVLLTRLTAGEIVLAKLVGRLPPVLAPIVVAWPLMAFTAHLGELPPTFFIGIVAVGLTTAVTAAALAIMVSARSENEEAAQVLALLLIGLWLVGPPIGSCLPTGGSPLWSIPAHGIRSISAVIAPTSPLSLGIDRTWSLDRTGTDFRNRVLLMIAAQAAITALAVHRASSRLRSHQQFLQPAVQSDPSGPAPPPCHDDPIVWREYDLPMWKARTWFHKAMRSITGAVIIVALSIALISAAVWLCGPALMERWQYGDDANAPFVARAKLNAPLRQGLFQMLFCGLMGLGAQAMGRIKLERDKRTWTILLTTPLTAEEIVRGKMRASIPFAFALGFCLLGVGLLGVVCGAIHPLGFALLVLDLMLAARLCVVLGLWAGAQERPNWLEPWFLTIGLVLLLVLNSVSVAAAICTSRDIDRLLAWDLRLRLGMISLLLATPLATGFCARALMRELLRKFDEWVDRPRRPVGMPAELPTEQPVDHAFPAGGTDGKEEVQHVP